MSNEDKTPVAGEVEGGEVLDPTKTLEAGGVQDGTTTTLTVDAEKLLLENQKLAKDINQVKSTLQRQIAEREKEFKTREKEFQRKLEELQKQGMDAETLKKYEAQLVETRAQEVEREKLAVEASQNEIKNTVAAMQYFVQKGVPVTELVLDQGYDALYASGMNWIFTKFDELQNQAATPPKKKVTRIDAPEVALEKGAPATTGPTWADLIKLYGSEEQVYTYVESGQLPSTIIPKPKAK